MSRVVSKSSKKTTFCQWVEAAIVAFGHTVYTAVRHNRNEKSADNVIKKNVYFVLMLVYTTDKGEANVRCHG